jgi:hypothetical protein
VVSGTEGRARDETIKIIDRIGRLRAARLSSMLRLFIAILCVSHFKGASESNSRP